MSAPYMTAEDQRRAQQQVRDLTAGKPLKQGDFQQLIDERWNPQAYQERKAREQRERLRPQNAAEEYASRQRAYQAYGSLEEEEPGGRRRASSFLTTTLGGA